jgi:hypothetical protein
LNPNLPEVAADTATHHGQMVAADTATHQALTADTGTSNAEFDLVDEVVDVKLVKSQVIFEPMVVEFKVQIFQRNSGSQRQLLLQCQNCLVHVSLDDKISPTVRPEEHIHEVGQHQFDDSTHVDNFFKSMFIIQHILTINTQCLVHDWVAELIFDRIFDVRDTDKSNF